MVIGSTNSFGSPDLDTRQPEMQRSTIYHWIQQCPKCGYCSPDLSECFDTTKEIVHSKAYQDIIASSAMPATATSFLAYSYELEMQQEFSDSAWQAIRAAWICDDNKDLESSTTCRIKAIALIEKANSHGQLLLDQLGANETITIDLMRRSGLHQQALALSQSIQKQDIDDIIRQIVQYQELLIAKSDNDAHTIDEMLTEL
jgi:hypothetical protein